MTLENIISLLGALGEFLIAYVIYYEWEGSRVDHFLHDANDKNEMRKDIFRAYCGLECDGERSRNQKFKEMLRLAEHENLKILCDENIRLFSRVGARLPTKLVWCLRNRVLDWHVVVYLWEILGPYVEERRSAAGSSFAKSFLEYALASVKHQLKQKKRDKWEITDPDLARRKNVIVTRDRLIQMQEELQTSLTNK